MAGLLIPDVLGLLNTWRWRQ